MSDPDRTATPSAVMNTFGPPKLVLARGEGAHVWDDDGKEYLDLLGGIAVNALGHGHPALVAAVTHQLATLGHVSNFFATEPQVEPRRAAARAERAPRARCSSPTPAPRPTRPRSSSPGDRPHPPRRRRGLLPRPHHGRARAHRQGGLPRAVRAAARRRHVRPVRRRRRAGRRRHRRDGRGRARADPGRGRRLVAPAGYLAAARRITRDHGALLWLDEVQTGIGRTGALVRAPPPSDGVEPDVVTLAKGLGGGIPIGACLALGDAGDAAPARQPRHHVRRQPGRRPRRRSRSSTRSRPTACSTTSPSSASSCATASPHDPRVTEVRGEGLLIGLDLDAERAAGVVRGGPRRTASSSTTPTPDRSGSPRRWSSPTTMPTRSWPPGRRSSTTPPTTRSPTHDPPLPARRRPDPGRAGRGAGLAADAEGRRRTTRKPLAGPRTVAIIFDKPTLRTQASFAAGIAELGGNPMMVDGSLAGIGVRESVADVARVLGRQASAIVWRTYGQDRARRDGGVRRRARSSTRSPTSSTPASCSPTC